MQEKFMYDHIYYGYATHTQLGYGEGIYEQLQLFRLPLWLHP